MKDTYIEFSCHFKSWQSTAERRKFAEYKDWIQNNLEEGTYHFPYMYPNRVYFLHTEDLLVFTMIFGNVYKKVSEVGVMSKVDKMIAIETAREKYNEKDHNRR